MRGTGVPTVLLILALVVVLSDWPGWVAVVLALAAALFAIRDVAIWGGGWDRDDLWDRLEAGELRCPLCGANVPIPEPGYLLRCENGHFYDEHGNASHDR